MMHIIANVPNPRWLCWQDERIINAETVHARDASAFHVIDAAAHHERLVDAAVSIWRSCHYLLALPAEEDDRFTVVGKTR